MEGQKSFKERVKETFISYAQDNIKIWVLRHSFKSAMMAHWKNMILILSKMDRVKVK